MPAALPIREDVSVGELRALARRESKGRVAARMFAITHALDEVSRADAARLAGMVGPLSRECSMNRIWHDAHPMPPKPTRQQRVEWHLEHAQACGCRQPPASLLDEIRDLEKQRAVPAEEDTA